MQKKLQSARGMTLMEILCAVAVLGLLTAAIAAALPTTAAIFQDLTSTSEATVLCSTLSEAVSQELRFAENILPAADGAFTYDSPRFGPGMRLGVYGEQDAAYVGVRAVADKSAAPYPLLSAVAYTSRTRLRDEADASFLYLPDKKLFHVVLIIYNPQTEATVKNEFDVRPLNPPAYSE